MPVQFTPREIAEKYDRFARWYDLAEGIPDLLGVRKLRRQLLQRASGMILEIAVGTGKNLPYYPADWRIAAVDLSSEMLNIARNRAAKLSKDIYFALADAQNLPFSDRMFDTVVSSLSACTFPNPVGALREIGRVCKSEGRIFLLEHGRSNREWLGRWQDRHEDTFAKRFGCHWNREPLELAREANLKVVAAWRGFLGIFHLIEAQPHSV
jgi:ubiquinone/menaquinone biosynthesis C-methylase UbiE